ncbi:methyl-accepting chemotaxis protein [Spirulina major]|uniref:methyl-accepting chemotaxis protein n=1 Tax=Spirulina major TaxID=270636 RepID=UPI000AE60272|nr:methyl-accepting chemotaxis protein [Spirulina major]
MKTPYHAQETMSTINNATAFQKQLSGFKVRTWIIGGYAIPIGLSILSAIAVFYNVQIVRTKETEVTRSINTSEYISLIGFEVQTLSRTTRGYLLDANSLSKQSYEEASATITETIPKLQDLVLDDQQQQTFDQLVKDISALEQINRTLFQIVDRGQTDLAIETWKTQRGREQIEAISRSLEDFNSREEAIVDANMTQQRETLNFLLWVVVLSAIMSILIASGAASWIIYNITKRLNDAANSLASSTTEIASTVEQQERTASQQAASVSETTTTMDELGASSRQSSQQAEAATDAAQRALHLSDGGTQAVDQTLAGITVLRDKVSAIAEQILHLSEQTGQIGNISQLVSDLANQTNMLALNAAVEAVRAGEHGKGFSVVASEIRKLADQSKQSAQKINDLVTDIQHAINSTVMVTDEGTKTVEVSVQSTQKTADAFAGVADAVNNVVLNNQQISLNIKQQSTAIEQVVQAMNSINQGAKETANGIRQTKTGTEQLKQAAQLLKEMV